jgi:hypothetical protein
MLTAAVVLLPVIALAALLRARLLVPRFLLARLPRFLLARLPRFLLAHLLLARLLLARLLLARLGRTLLLLPPLLHALFEKLLLLLLHALLLFPHFGERGTDEFSMSGLLWAITKLTPLPKPRLVPAEIALISKSGC